MEREEGGYQSDLKKYYSQVSGLGNDFGWELMTWIPHVRAVAKDYNHVVIGCQTGHQALYEFADEFIIYDCGKNQSNQWMNNQFKNSAEELARSTIAGTEITWLNPQKAYDPTFTTTENWLAGLQPQEFKSYQVIVPKSIDICLNIRSRDDWDSGFRNWSLRHAESFAERFPDKKIVCIGTPEQSLCGQGMTDYRGVPAEITANILSSSKVFVSSINGAQHFATLCKTPQVVWVTKPDHAERVRDTWNPFNVPTHVFVSPEGYWKNRVQWHPEIDKLVEAVGRFL